MNKIQPKGVCIVAFACLLFSLSTAQSGTTIPTELNKFATIVRDDGQKLGIMVTGVEYATGWNPVNSYFYPRSEQKLLIVHFIAKNQNARDMRYAAVSTEFTAVGSDYAEFSQNQTGHKSSRIAGRVDTFDGTLKPGQSIALYSAVVVDGDAQIEGIRVDPQTISKNSTSIELNVAGQVAELPAFLTDNGNYKNDFDGKFKQTYRMSTADVSLTSFSTLGGKLPASPNDKEISWGIVNVNIRNVHLESKRVFYDAMKPTRVLTNTGRLVAARYFLNPDLKERYDKTIAYGVAVEGAYAFPLEDGESVIEVFLRERPNRAADDKETSITIHYTLNADQNPLDKFFNTSIAQQISGANRGPRFEGENVAPGVYDPIRSWANYFADNGSIPQDALNGTGPKDLVGMTITPFLTPPPVIANRPENQTPATTPPTQPKETPTPPNVNMAIRVKDLSVWNPEDNGGDEPWVAIIEFRGVPGQPQTAESVFIPSTQCKTVGSGMQDKATAQLSTQLGLREFRDIKPYEMIGVYVISAEVDGGSASDRDSSAVNMARKLFNEWKAFLGKANPYPLNDFTNDNVRRQAVRLNMAFNQFIRPLQFYTDFKAPGTVDNDNFIANTGMLWMYLPGLSDGQALAISRIPSISPAPNQLGPGSGYIPRGTWTLEHYRQGPSAWYRFTTELYKLN